MENLNTVYHPLYVQALKDPIQIEESALQELIARYPYSQPLHFALAKRRYLLSDASDSQLTAVLFASNVNWLWDFVNRPVRQEEDLLIEDLLIENEEEYIPFVDVEEKQNTDKLEGQKSFSEFVEDSDTEDEEEVADDRTLEKLIQGGASSADFFVFESKNDVEKDLPVQKDEAAAQEEENISLYNDELLPYSFRWWLHKTRLEYADTYQPFASPMFPEPYKRPFNPQKIDEAVLDQQIKENIFHLQDPEVKLSEATKMKRVPYNPAPKKVDEVIEKFIREDPIIHPPSPEQLNTENKARRSAEDNYTLVTETLANVYADQNLYLKAIEVFKKLILKYPEKKSYFASRIKELEKNI
ncbi:hypothetical protein FAZ15_10665 [Sphingobacterium olei]|uniref:Tetratricopeptide repeat protein n=1 Tax=Sphingobacterium olei TaxID=2571155 RepID=A0A4U0NZV6_9SPHI|nr:hypothetical protein [Sphingobacterium olei]TJZ60457.1 hypothetical protein FAZ15_10665 [Sphingobacterium olei]